MSINGFEEVNRIGETRDLTFFTNITLYAGNPAENTTGECDCFGKKEPILGTGRQGSGPQFYTDLNSVCYNSITEQGQMFWIAAARGRYGSKFDVLSMLSISPGI